MPVEQRSLPPPGGSASRNRNNACSPSSVALEQVIGYRADALSALYYPSPVSSQPGYNYSNHSGGSGSGSGSRETGAHPVTGSEFDTTRLGLYLNCLSYAQKQQEQTYLQQKAAQYQQSLYLESVRGRSRTSGSKSGGGKPPRSRSVDVPLNKLKIAFSQAHLNSLTSKLLASSAKMLSKTVTSPTKIRPILVMRRESLSSSEGSGSGSLSHPSDRSSSHQHPAESGDRYSPSSSSGNITGSPSCSPGTKEPGKSALKKPVRQNSPTTFVDPLQQELSHRLKKHYIPYDEDLSSSTDHASNKSSYPLATTTTASSLTTGARSGSPGTDQSSESEDQSSSSSTSLPRDTSAMGGAESPPSSSSGPLGSFWRHSKRGHPLQSSTTKKNVTFSAYATVQLMQSKQSKQSAKSLTRTEALVSDRNNNNNGPFSGMYHPHHHIAQHQHLHHGLAATSGHSHFNPLSAAHQGNVALLKLKKEREKQQQALISGQAIK